MKIQSVIFLLVVSHCCFAQTDTNLIGAGAWSEPVGDSKEWNAVMIRGRLLLYDDQAAEANNEARVYLELQHILKPTSGLIPVEIYYNPNMGVDSGPPGLLLRLFDENG